MIRTFIQVMALSLVFIASVFLIKGMVSLSAKNIVELSESRYGIHSGIVRNLTTQKADTIVGVILLLASFTLSLVNVLWPMRFVDFGVSRKGAITAIIVAVVIFVVAMWFSNFLQQRWYGQIMGIDTQKEAK